MPPIIATFILILLIIYLFWADRRNNEGFSKAIWLPFLWILFSTSRHLTEWLDLEPTDLSSTANAMLEGDPVNRTVYTVLIIAGILVLLKRKLDWNTIFVKNKCIWLYFIFGVLSFIWSDYPYVAFKRWFKASGVLIMALVVLTEARPYMALGVILRRLAFILLPLSVLFIKYYPELGRAYFMGQPMYIGVTSQKNALGTLCLITGIYFSWKLFYSRKVPHEKSQHLPYSIYLIMIPMIAWLLYMADSATSLACLVFAILLFVIARQPTFARKPNKIIMACVAGAVIFGLLELAFDFKDLISEILGRNPTLTNRTEIWNFLLGFSTNTLVGAGYESFWLGERFDLIQQRFGGILQAHNGYLEMYLNMGLIGVSFIACWIVSGILSVRRHLASDYPAAVLRLCFILVAVLYNYTEATFYGASTIWLLFFIGILTMPEQLKKHKTGIDTPHSHMIV